MSDSHKAALAEGRSQGRAVRTYLEAIEAHKPKRGRKRTPESMKKKLEKIDLDYANADQLKRLQLAQQRLDLQSDLDAAGSTVDMASLEQDFVAAAQAYGQRKGITWAAWRQVGVSDAILNQAGINRLA